ncbi:LysR family transcriptional regulator [Microbacterium terrisoli]|uniref:LysR family transcriptional regulator n=1 Tax=Microbacterium terrisoli TaxID=3242192 RepID=UPI002805EB7D|nr:LysR family transcriptional regulator [Microbacterium protaetiae]
MNGGTLRQLEYFVAAVETGTVSAAAVRCQASQAAVSAALNDLERALGMQLLVRRPAKGVTVTGGGQSVLPIARRMLADAAELADLAAAEHGEVAGRLRIACTIALSPRVLPLLAALLTVRYPRVELDVTDGLATDVQEWARAGVADACLLYRRQLGEGLDARTVCVVEPYAVLAADHPLADRDDLALEELSGEQLIIVRAAESSRVIEALMEDAGVVPHAGWAFSNPETVRAMVAHGLGYSVFSGRPSGTEAFDGRRVAYVRVRDRVAPNEVVLAVPRGQRPNARLDALWKLLGEPELQAAFG